RAGGVESMTRAPYVMLKASEPFSRKTPEVADTTVGWRFINPRMKKEWTISLGETAEVVAERYKISRAEQDAFAVESQRRAATALKECVFTDELVPVALPDGSLFAKDEYPRAGTTLDSVAKIITTLVHALQRRNTQYGLATMCIGVGQGIAMIVERV